MASTDRTDRTLITLIEAARRVGVHPRTMRRYVSDGLIAGYTVGPRLVKFDVADLDALVRRIPAARR